MTLSTGAIAALSQLAKTDHTAETVFYGYASDPPIKTPEFRELALADLVEMHGRTLRLTPAGVAKLATINGAGDELDPLKAAFHAPRLGNGAVPYAPTEEV